MPHKRLAECCIFLLATSRILPNSTEDNCLERSQIISPSLLEVVVFFATRDTVDFHYSLLNEFRGLLKSQSEEEVRPMFLSCKIFRLHGEMEHVDRRTAFQCFRTEKSALLLSTDVAARGLDFPKVRCIIQYDPPGEATEYVHRYVLS